MEMDAWQVKKRHYPISNSIESVWRLAGARRAELPRGSSICAAAAARRAAAIIARAISDAGYYCWRANQTP